MTYKAYIEDCKLQDKLNKLSSKLKYNAGWLQDQSWINCAGRIDENFKKSSKARIEWATSHRAIKISLIRQVDP